MKKTAVIFLVMILLGFLVVAEDDGENGDVSINRERLREDAEKLKGTLDDRTEDLLEREVEIPSWLETPAKVLFGIEQGVTWQRLIVVLGFLIMVFIILNSILELMFPENRKIINVFGSLVVVIIISITGVFDSFSKVIVDLTSFFGFLEISRWLNFLISIVLIIIIVFFALRVSKNFKKEWNIENAERKGKTAGSTIRMLEGISKGE